MEKHFYYKKKCYPLIQLIRYTWLKLSFAIAEHYRCFNGEYSHMKCFILLITNNHEYFYLNTLCTRGNNSRTLE